MRSTTGAARAPFSPSPPRASPPRGRRRRRPPLALALACALLTACGWGSPPDRPEPVDRHGLDVDELTSSPTGSPRLFEPRLRVGAWTADLTVHVESERADGTRSSGAAALEIEHARERTPEGGWVSRVDFRVVSADGLAEALFGGLEGLRVTVPHGPEGRPDRRHLIVDGSPHAARDFFSRPWLAGFGAAPSWVPLRPVATGGTWSLDELGLADPAEQVQALRDRTGAALPDVVRRGGARLESLDEAAGTLTVRLEALAEVEGPVQMPAHRLVSLGDRVLGRAVLHADTLDPVSWRCTEHVRIIQSGGSPSVSQDISMRWEGRVRPGAD